MIRLVFEECLAGGQLMSTQFGDIFDFPAVGLAKCGGLEKAM
jgi:hypothetical protein